MLSESDSIQVHQIIEFDGLLGDVFDSWLKVQNMIGREKKKLPFTGLYDYMTYFYTQYVQHMYDRLRYGTMKSGMCVHFTEASQIWIALLKCTTIM